MVKGINFDVPGEPSRTGRTIPSKFSSSQLGSTSRVSVLSSVVPYLRRQDHEDAQKQPLLTLKLSASSFLDSAVNDDITEQPLYVIRTIGTSTTIKRADPWDGDTKTAEIKWPKNAPAKGKGMSDEVLIHMRGVRWKGSETLLRRGTLLSAPRKFNIPNYSHNLKWRRVGNSYWCTTASVKGPIAIFDPSSESHTPRLNIYETLHDRHDARPMLVHHGVSLLLLDYLLVTSLLLVTDVQEWMLAKRFEDITVPYGHLPNIPDMTPPKSAPGNISTSNLQWRKIMYGEPLFPKRTSRSSLSSGSTTSDAIPRTPISAGQMAKLAYGHPLYPTLRSSSPDPSTSDSEDDNSPTYFSPVRTRPPSPSAESIFYPRSTGSAPSHNYLDPTFYSEADVPPVPPIPAQYNVASGSSPSRAFSTSSRPSSSHSTASTRRLRELPLPPIPPLIPRPQSTPPRTMASPTSSQAHVSRPGTSGSLSPSRRLPDPSTPRRPTRQLPPLPARVDSINPHGSVALGRSRSHSFHQEEKWNRQYRQRTLPSPPVGSSRGGEHPVEVDHGPHHGTLKVAEDGLTRWMHALTGPREFSSMPSAAFDMPPPAYNSINFSSRIQLPNSPPPPPTPIPASLSTNES